MLKTLKDPVLAECIYKIRKFERNWVKMSNCVRVLRSRLTKGYATYALQQISLCIHYIKDQTRAYHTERFCMKLPIKYIKYDSIPSKYFLHVFMSQNSHDR